MPSKRKRDIMDFDPNKSDSEDENFEPGEDRPRRSAKKSRPSKSRAGPSSRSRRRRHGSDIVDDDDEDLSDSGQENSFVEDDDDDEDDVDLPTNAAGRRTRKVAAKAQNYAESSDENDRFEEVIKDTDQESDAVEEPPMKKAPKSRPTRVITIKTSRSLRRSKEPPTPSSTTRRTRANTEEAEEFLELTNSGKHAMTARSSKSKSPETMLQSRRSTRGSKGLKKPPEPIQEATQESSLRGPAGEGDNGVASLDGAQDGEVDDEIKDQESEGEGKREGDADEKIAAVEESAKGNVDDDEDELMIVDKSAAPDEDEDDVPITRRTRSRASISAPAAEDAEAEDKLGDTGPTRRLTRGSSLRKKKSTQEPSSDFDPGEDDSGDGEASAAESKGKNNGSGSNGDEDYSSQNSRGRRGKRPAKKKKSSRRESEDEDDVDHDEVAQEAEELRASSHSRPRRRRSPSIAYEQLSSKRRRTAKPVDYSIKPLDQFLIEPEDDDQDPAPTPARRRNARAGGAGAWQRNLLSTFGPFGGGGGAGSILGGPWGASATGGVESDSSDDERPPRAAVGGNVGMTPTSAAVPGFAAPLNLEAITGVSATPNVGKVKNQKAFADADPLGVDMTVDFSKVGGLQNHINQLKEMVTLPLLYPELFLRFKVTPPRGVLFHGPPGTGKTLLARALANSVGIGGRKITFYMRKGADALSKWVGEAEKQLRLLFEEARRTQPSIIFFDEIDGLAPVRSSKQEQIHASIVSTLLALMDGMDGRGQVIVIGATNRPDNIDPALRRPGRFDREFYFPLPDLEGRQAILDIHTKDWGLAPQFKRTLAENSKGYGGADLRALCTEASLNAIQRTYPQIYSSNEKLIVDPDKIDIHATDFMISMKRMVPSSERSASSGAAPLPKVVEPLLRRQFAEIVQVLNEILPRKKKVTALEEAMFEPDDDMDQGFGRENLSQEFERLRVFKPRLLITSKPGMGQGYIAAATLHHFEGVHVQTFDLPSLLGDGRAPEQVVVSRFIEVKRHKPAVIYIPDIDTWQAAMPGSVYATFINMVRTIAPNDPVLVLATAECDVKDIPEHILKDLFAISRKNRTEIARPNKESRYEYFTTVVSHIGKSPSDFPDPAKRKRRVLEELPVAPPPPPKPKTKADIKEELRKDHLLLNLLKVQLQPIMDQIKKYKKFRQGVIADAQIQYLFHEAEPNYVRPDVADAELQLLRPFEIAKDKDGKEGLRHTPSGKFYYNLDLATIEERLSNGYYARPRDFYIDVCSLAKDAKNFGDKERVLKANELVTNVEVDVAEAEARLIQADWEALYQRQLQRARDAAEKERKRKAAQSMVDLIQSDMPDSDSQDRVGPVRIGESIPGTTTARFRLMSPGLYLQARPGAAEAQPQSNGTSVPSRPEGEDVRMGGVDEEPSQPLSQMGPPSQWPRTEPRPLDVSTRATAGNTQISQVSAVTALPPGVSPSAVLNDASTTKTSDLSTNRSSERWNTQSTNGFHSQAVDPEGDLPDTQPGGSQAPPPHPGTTPPSGSPLDASQGTSSDGAWPHSQAHGLAKGILQPRLHFHSSSGSGSGQTSPPSSQLAAAAAASASAAAAASPSKTPRSAAPSMANLLNNDSADEGAGGAASTAGGGAGASAGPRNSGSSASSSQPNPIFPAEAHVRNLLVELSERTSGCTVEQLEQIHHALMEELWGTRNDYNRSRVLGQLSRAFNDTMADMEEMQEIFPQSQEEERALHERRFRVLR